MKFEYKEKLGSIVSKFPKAADIFQMYQIDYCCGGDRLLKDVCESQKIDINELINKLEKHFKLSNKNIVDWTNASYDELVNHIMQAHHAYLNEMLPIIYDETKAILRVHGNTHQELEEVFQLFSSLKADMDHHLIKEETKQYPAIEKYLATHDIMDLEKAITIIDELEDDHDTVGTILKRLRKITNDYQLPDDACQTFVHAYQHLQSLEQNTFTHVHLENNILFPRLKNTLNKGWKI